MDKHRAAQSGLSPSDTRSQIALADQGGYYCNKWCVLDAHPVAPSTPVICRPRMRPWLIHLFGKHHCAHMWRCWCVAACKTQSMKASIPMPSVNTTRVHDLSPPKLTRMRMELFGEIPEYGISFELGTVKAHVSHYDACDVHPFMGFLYVDDRRFDSVTGIIRGVLPSPSRGGRKPKIGRDIAVFLARKHYEAYGPEKDEYNQGLSVDGSVVKCWTDRRAHSLRAQSQDQATRADHVEKVLPLDEFPPKPKETHSGITLPSHISHAVGRAKEHLADTILGVIGGRFSSEKEGSIMILLLRGSGFDRTAKDADRAALHGPFWAWVFGEEEAKYFSEGQSFDVTLDTPIHPGWYVAKNGQLTTDFKS